MNCNIVEGWRIAQQTAPKYHGRPDLGISLYASEKTGGKKKGYVLFLIQTTSDIISLHLLAISEANGLFVLPWEFSKPKDNSFKANDETTMLLSLQWGKKNTSMFQLGGPIITSEYLLICLSLQWFKAASKEAFNSVRYNNLKTHKGENPINYREEKWEVDRIQ